MSRAKISRGGQREFLNSVQKATNFDWDTIAKLCNVCPRSLQDWRREKCNMNYEALLKLYKISKAPIPKDIEVLPEYWSTKKAAKIGAVRRYEVYGNPGTPEGRRKGGINSQKKFRLNPEYAKKVGIKVRKYINQPSFSPLLAEFVGILLGDGGISDYQVSITFNRETDREYSIFLQKIVEDLFSISPSTVLTKTDKGDNVVISSKNLVEFLKKIGLKKRNKVRQQINIPDWIWQDKRYQIACLRGLIDTDGSFYSYCHKTYNKIYCNFAMGFANHSKPLLKSVYKILKLLNFAPTITKNNRVYLYRKKDINRYFLEIDTHNPKHRKKYDEYIRGRASGFESRPLRQNT